MKRLFIANRGEIAVRIARSAKEMGVEVAALIPPQDVSGPLRELLANSLSVGSNEEAREMFLNPGRMVECANQLGCDAVHPGYGFLSENPEFADAVQATGLTWIGPSADAIRIMGDKSMARAVAEDAKVPLAPGVCLLPGQLTLSTEDLKMIGFPMMIKAAAGGGGRGMRHVRDAAHLEASIEEARRESLSSFGDDTLIAESLITDARHIEVQILADQHGDVRALGERECSIQRRNQKVLEESPSEYVTDTTRTLLYEAACSLSREVGYVGAGTVEFMVRDSGGGQKISFLEMNTRLQVEHGVTELCFDIDLVRAQLAIAEGESLSSLLPSVIESRGHAIEVRLCSEDPFSGYLPQVGSIHALHLPEGPGVRVDAGIGVGSVVSTAFDSLIAKILVWGKDRGEALERLTAALQQTMIHGVVTNLPLLLALSRDRTVAAGQVTTAWLESSTPLGVIASEVSSLAAAIESGQWPEGIPLRPLCNSHSGGQFTTTAFVRGRGFLP